MIYPYNNAVLFMYSWSLSSYLYALAHPVQCCYNCPVLIVVFLSLLLFSLEKVLKSDDKFIDTKKALLKKREEDIVKEAKAAADKKVLSFIIIFYSVIM